MRYISLSFDDGRSDNYEFAFPIMRKYGFAGTVFCTTGFIDGSWCVPNDWNSVEKPLSLNQISDLFKSGWEIGLHGDKHVTELPDLQTAILKLRTWGYSEPFGFSIPNSNDNNGKDEIVKALVPKSICYIRYGRARKTQLFSSKLLYALYRVLGIRIAYNRFNYQSVIRKTNLIGKELPSVVIRCEDKPNMIIDFLRGLEDDTWVVFMLHSILPKKHKLYNSDPWNWSTERFEVFCQELSRMEKKHYLNVSPIRNILDGDI